MKDSFVLYTSYLEQVELLNIEQRGILFTSMLRHASDLEIPQMDTITQMLFSIIKNQMDKDAAKYAETCERRKEAGRAGGKQKAENLANLANASNGLAKSSKAKQNLAKLAEYDNEYEYECENECDSENDFDFENEGENDLGGKIPPKAPLENVQEQAGRKPSRAKSAQDETFEAFWELYPKKKSKEAARKRWEALKPSREIVAAIMDKLPQLIASHEWQKDGGQYIPYPATWLNAGGWNDEVASYTPPPTREPQRNAYLDAIENRVERVDEWV